MIVLSRRSAPRRISCPDQDHIQNGRRGPHRMQARAALLPVEFALQGRLKWRAAEETVKTVEMFSWPSSPTG